MFKDTLKQLLNDSKECATQCRADIRKAGDFARSDEGRAIRTKANELHAGTCAEDRAEFKKLMDAGIL